MHILEVIIDGFKSYATRTVVSGFDPAFNAITGLNGSGKSNILDAICFVLGISNLSQVRAANLQDLVYKQGQAGVTKASVTIVFDNSEIKSSPVGYEGEKRLCVTREVVVGGRNRYLINGKGAQASSVANLFQSVQLNVNNPHFLIMQGRITKVLNMKPPEILSMVEEAAGTRMFESKKQAALKTLDKKQAKVDEIDRVLAADITPTLERLREEKSHYLRWSANAAEVSRLERFCVAAEYDEAEKAAAVSGEGAATAEREAQALEQEASDKAEEAEAKKAQEAKCRAKDGAAGLASQRRKELKKAVDDASTEVARLEAAQKGAQTAFDADDSRLKGEAENAADNERIESAKQEEVALCEQAVEKCSTEKDEADQAFQNAETVHKEALAGKGTTDTKSVSEQLAAHKDAQRTARATLKKCDAKQSALEKRRDQAAELAAKYASSAKGLKKAFSSCEAKVSACQSKVDAHAAKSPGDADSLQRQAKELSQKARECSQRAQRTEAQLKARLKFDYEHPGKGFDAEKVRGVLASLVTPCDGKYAAALEVVAGGRLYQVVVDDEKTGKALLERGQLRRRVTLIPLNKVRAGRLDDKRCQRASSVAKKAGGSARIALEFVGHEQHVKNAVEYAFGGALVCDSMDVARAVAFDSGVKARCVTLDGDVCDPRGTLSGGSRSGNLGACLGLVVALHQQQTEASEASERAREACALADASSKHANELRTLTSALGVATAELNAAREELEASDAGSAVVKLETLDKELQQLEDDRQTALKTDEESSAKLEALERDGKKIEQARRQELEKLNKEAKAKKKGADQAKKALSEAEKRLKKARAELQALGDERSASGTSLKGLENALNASKRALERADKALAEATAVRDEAQAGLDEAAAELDAAESEARQLGEEATAARKRAAACDVEAKKATHAAARLKTEAANAARRVESLTEKHTWIPHEKGFFGCAGGDYDFAAREGGAARARADLDKLERAQDKLARKINKRVMGMIEKSERDYDDLTAKKATVARDRSKIEAVISELEVKKQETLEATWQKVNRDFGSIFSSLLPGAHAKLEPPEGATSVLDGLEVKVGFGGLWKESLSVWKSTRRHAIEQDERAAKFCFPHRSLSELSGGQRSLIALSLVLAMLLFKPAPMYILDEVDAALDLSHTQNIGVMLRAHFKASQFIVVSLKEGMFNNANVVFRTKFVDGVSTVARTTTKHNTSTKRAKK